MPFELSLFVDPRFPAQVVADPTRLRQILFNLAGNAIKFSGGRADTVGKVAVRAEFEPGLHPQWTLVVDDNGIGIAPEALGQVFASFTQAESSTTRRFGGTGLGLTICKRLVHLMGGEVDVRSTPKIGSCFSVRLPLEIGAASPWQSPVDLSGLVCIIVGTHIQPVDLCVYLAHAGARAVLASDLDDARQTLPEKTPALIIHNHRCEPSAGALAAWTGDSDARHLMLVRGRRVPPSMPDSDSDFDSDFDTDTVTLNCSVLRRSAFLQAVAVAAGRASPQSLRENTDENSVIDLLLPPSIVDARAQGRLILVAEDDEINKKVIWRQLAVLGYAAEIASNGVEALAMWQGGHYGLLLSDLHMPDMDGYALAESIRKAEALRGVTQQERMPILALTANALRGEALRAKAAGMDEYLTKPIQLNLLQDALSQWMPKGSEADGKIVIADVRPSSVPPDNARTVPALDITVLQALVGDDPSTVREFLREYQVAVRLAATELHAVQDTQDVRQIGAIAHKLKSSSRSVGAMVLGDLCAELENACRSDMSVDVSKTVARLVVEMALVQSWLDRDLL